jgi:uncharacterized protein YjbI with pentapeptide repeats
MAKANLSNVDFTDANLVGADFRKVILEGSMLKRAGLVMTDLTRATLEGVHLRVADLGKTDLIKTDPSAR